MDEMNRREALKKVVAGVLGGAAVMVAAVAGAAPTVGRKPGQRDSDHGPHGGYGSCVKCNCRHYEGNAYTCANSGCGHSYYDHY